MRLTPPQPSLYLGRHVLPGAYVDVLPIDMEALLAEGWLGEAVAIEAVSLVVRGGGQRPDDLDPED